MAAGEHGAKADAYFTSHAAVCAGSIGWKGGKIAEYAEALVSSGFLARDHAWSLKTGEESKYSRFRLSDYYLRLYLKYIEPNRRRIERGTLSRPPNRDTIPPTPTK